MLQLPDHHVVSVCLDFLEDYVADISLPSDASHPLFQYLSQVLLLLLNHASFPLSLLRYQVMESPINCNQISMPLTHNPTDPSLAHNPTNPSLAHNPTNSLFAPHDDSSLLMAVELRTQLVVSLALRLLHRRYLFRYQDSWISKIQSS